MHIKFGVYQGLGDIWYDTEKDMYLLILFRIKYLLRVILYFLLLYYFVLSSFYVSVSVQYTYTRQRDL